MTGRTQLTKALQPLMQAAERALHLDKAKRARTIVRVDAGGGSLDDVNWLLSRGYQVHAKDYSGRHARSLAKSVLVWFDDPHIPDRQAGWVTEARHLPMCVQWCALPCGVANRTGNGRLGS